MDLVNIMQGNIDGINSRIEELQLMCKLLGAGETVTIDDSLKHLTAKVERVNICMKYRFLFMMKCGKSFIAL